MPQRSLEREYMDDHTPPQEVVDEVYRFLGAIGRWLGGTRATLRRFEEFSRGWTVGERITVLDVASGGGDIARALIRWGRVRGFDLQVTALGISLRALDRLAIRGVVVNDLVRRWRPYAWSWLFTRPFNAVLRNDGPLSVRRAFRRDELCALARRSGMAWLSMRTHFGHRMTLAGERPR